MFRLEIDTANDAFVGYPAGEVARILRETADDLDAGIIAFSIRDSNGNTVGSWELSEEEE